MKGTDVDQPRNLAKKSVTVEWGQNTAFSQAGNNRRVLVSDLGLEIRDAVEFVAAYRKLFGGVLPVNSLYAP